MTQNNQRLQHLETRHVVYFWQTSVCNEHFLYFVLLIGRKERGPGGCLFVIFNLAFISYSCIVYKKLIQLAKSSLIIHGGAYFSAVCG